MPNLMRALLGHSVETSNLDGNHMKPNLAERATKIQDAIQRLPKEVIRQNKQFFDDVWNFCGAVIDAPSEGGRQVTPARSLG